MPFTEPVEVYAGLPSSNSHCLDVIELLDIDSENLLRLPDRFLVARVLRGLRNSRATWQSR